MIGVYVYTELEQDGLSCDSTETLILEADGIVSSLGNDTAKLAQV